MNEVTFGYTPEKIVLKGVNIDVGLDSRIAIVGANGSGKSTLYVIASSLRPPNANYLHTHLPSVKVLTGELNPMAGHVTRNGRLRVYVPYLLLLTVTRFLTRVWTQWLFRSASRRHTRSYNDTSSILGFAVPW